MARGQNGDITPDKVNDSTYTFTMPDYGVIIGAISSSTGTR